MNRISGGEGVIELHWPAPAMTLETNPLVVYLYGCFFMASFICVAFLSASPALHWQSRISSGLLVGGHVVLILGHVTAQYAVKFQREVLKLKVSMDKPTHWSMVDGSRFTSAVTQRSFPRLPRRFFALRQSNSTVTLSQYHRFTSNYIASWQALLSLFFLILGFVAFYLGGKSSDVRTMIIYIVLFVLANVLKGPVILYANKPPRYTRLNNFRHDDNGSWNDNEDPKECKSEPDSKPETPSVFPKPFHIYSKFFIRDRRATDIFCFSSTDEWVLAAHVISRAVRPIAQPDLTDQNNNPDNFLQIPLYQWHGAETFHGLLLLSIDQIKPEHLFWSVGMEIASILMGKFDSTTIFSQDRSATNTNVIAAFVFTCVRALLSEHVYCGNVLLPCKLRGTRSLMRAIEYTVSHTTEPSDVDMPGLLALLNRAADAAKEGRGVNLKSKGMLAYEDLRFSRLSGDTGSATLKKMDGCMMHLRQIEELVESGEPQQLVQLPLELRELRGMLSQLMDLDHELELSVFPLQDQISQLRDKLQLIGLLGKIDPVHRRREALWEEAQGDLKDAMQELVHVPSSWRQSCWHTQEILRRRERQRQAKVMSKRASEKVMKEELRWEVRCLMAQLGAILQEQQSLLREQLRRELQDELPPITSDERQRVEQEMGKTKQHMVRLQQELMDRIEELEEPEEYVLRLHLLEIKYFYLAQELQQMASQ